ncbi:hypothetical protein, partial [Ralstonia solanacearum]|uniref:hypothetical protein n=1 Tax=Ralstonia solanacearum TaxID=305 RepID=UPI001E63C080
NRGEQVRGTTAPHKDHPILMEHHARVCLKIQRKLCEFVRKCASHLTHSLAPESERIWKIRVSRNLLRKFDIPPINEDWISGRLTEILKSPSFEGMR